jgi:Holliday junction resolvase-like predicted endonuclease
MVPAEMAVDANKQAELRRMAKVFLRRQRPHTDSRFDVVSVYLSSGEPAQIELFKDAFGWRSMGGRRRQWR